MSNEEFEQLVIDEQAAWIEFQRLKMPIDSDLERANRKWVDLHRSKLREQNRREILAEEAAKQQQPQQEKNV